MNSILQDLENELLIAEKFNFSKSEIENIKRLIEKEKRRLKRDENISNTFNLFFPV